MICGEATDVRAAFAGDDALKSIPKAFHISRPVRWDSDHVIRQNDDLRNAAQEIVRMGPENFIIALDYAVTAVRQVFNRRSLSAMATASEREEAFRRAKAVLRWAFTQSRPIPSWAAISALLSPLAT